MISILDLFSIGIGPSSSHTVGPMRAARHFAETLNASGMLERVDRLRIELFGSLALTGSGHGTDRAVMMGLEGCCPETADPGAILRDCARVTEENKLRILGHTLIDFNPHADIRFVDDQLLPLHSNGLRFAAEDAGGAAVAAAEYYSTGGGFVTDGQGMPLGAGSQDAFPYPFASAAELLEICGRHGCSIDRLVWANEVVRHGEAPLREKLLSVWEVMNDAIERGLRNEGTLPGFQLKRRAPRLFARLKERRESEIEPEMSGLDWLSTYAIAVNEENAAGGRVVTAPTNGAAGVIPAVLRYAVEHEPQPSEEFVLKFLLTAGAVGILFKEGASLSAAEVGCQGEVGVACSMAAAALAAVRGGTNKQIENAAEIAMEHNLGLTCDPVGGFVQIPCIERNAVGASKAVTAARLALLSDGEHVVSLDRVIATMKKTGADMSVKYKETSLGGLAVAVTLPEC